MTILAGARHPISLLLALLLLAGCTSVSQMQRRYEAGDESQLDQLIAIVARFDYPYGTRRKAARALGEIGSPKAVPVLTGVLLEYEQRTTLKQDAVVALGLIGDTTAVEPIGRMLDYHLNESNSELRLAAVEVLGKLVCGQAAGILLNALRYYDQAMLYQEQLTLRGVFSGEEQENPYGPFHPTHPDSLAQRPQMGGLLPEERGQILNMFGMPLETFQGQESPIPQERQLAHRALVQIGEPAVAVLEEHLERKQTTQTLRRELMEILLEIRQPMPAGGDAPVQAAPPPN
ncbi:MAG: HEAT repeat domain-containing protein [Candidatus Latescibacterota bacterium]